MTQAVIFGCYAEGTSPLHLEENHPWQLVPTEIDEQGRGAEFTLSDGSTFGVWNGGDGDPSAGGAVMFAVPDAAATVAQLRARGVEISDPMETPVCKMAFGNDPDGNAYIIHQRTARD